METTTVKLGLKFFDTFDSKHLFPLSLKLIDTPGKIRNSTSQIKYSFAKPSIIFLCFDYSQKLSKQEIIEWTKFTIEKVQKYHPSFNADQIIEIQSQYMSEAHGGLSARSNDLNQ